MTPLGYRDIYWRVNFVQIKTYERKLLSGVDLALGLGTHQVVDALTMLLELLLQKIVFHLEIILVFFEEGEPE